jgi:hypothetical protein
VTETEALLSAVIVALARTWDTKLPGFLSEFQSQLDHVYLQTQASEVGLRTAIEQLSRSLS